MSTQTTNKGAEFGKSKPLSFLHGHADSDAFFIRIEIMRKGNPIDGGQLVGRTEEQRREFIYFHHKFMGG